MANIINGQLSYSKNTPSAHEVRTIDTSIAFSRSVSIEHSESGLLAQ